MIPKVLVNPLTKQLNRGMGGGGQCREKHLKVDKISNMDNCICYVNAHIFSSLRSCIALNEAFKARVSNHCTRVKTQVWTDGHSLKIHNPPFPKSLYNEDQGVVGPNNMPSTCPYFLAVLNQAVLIIL